MGWTEKERKYAGEKGEKVLVKGLTSTTSPCGSVVSYPPYSVSGRCSDGL